jgi:hypothetical protein
MKIMNKNNNLVPRIKDYMLRLNNNNIYLYFNLEVLYCYIKLKNSSKISNVHELCLHDPIPLHKPKITRPRYNSEFSLLHTKNIGPLNFQTTPFEFSISENHRENHVQAFAIQLRVDVQALIEPCLSPLIRCRGPPLLDHRRLPLCQSVGCWRWVLFCRPP